MRDSISLTVSSATPTTIKRPVPPNWNGTEKYFWSSAGNMQTTDRYSALANVICESTRSMYCAVFFPGRMPGMKPPDFFKLSATSTGLNPTDVKKNAKNTISTEKMKLS